MDKTKQKKVIQLGQLEALTEKQQENLPFPKVYEVKGRAYAIYTDKNGDTHKIKLGKCIRVTNVIEDVDTGKTIIVLSNNKTEYHLNPSELTPDTILKIADSGFGVSFSNRYHYHCYIENLKSIAKRTFCHSQLGFGIFKKTLDVFKFREIVTKNKTCESIYNGMFKLSESGTVESWSEGIKSLVVGRSVALQIIMLAAPCALLNGYIGEELGIETLIAHVYGSSSTGKTSSLKIASSFACDSNVSEDSFFNTWTGTSNSLLNILSDNMGILTIFDDTSSATIKDMENFIYKVSTGRDKRRLSSSIEQLKTGRWKTLVLSSGEEPLLMGKEPKDGAMLRILEFPDLQITDSPQHAYDINKFVQENYGCAITPLAQFMLQIGKPELIERFNKTYNFLLKKLDSSKYNARLCKAYTLFILSARLMNDCFCLGIKVKNIRQFFIDYHKQYKVIEAVEDRAWEFIKNAIAINSANFEIIKRGYFNDKKDKVIKTLYGNIQQYDGYCEVAIVKPICDKLLQDGGFGNVNHIYKSFKEKQYIITDDGCYSQKRTVGQLRVRCVVFVFSDKEISNFLTHLKVREEKRSKKIRKKAGRK